MHMSQCLSTDTLALHASVPEERAVSSALINILPRGVQKRAPFFGWQLYTVACLTVWKTSIVSETEPAYGI